MGTVSLTKEITLISLVQNKENAKLLSVFFFCGRVCRFLCLFVYYLLLYTCSRALEIGLSLMVMVPKCFRATKC